MPALSFTYLFYLEMTKRFPALASTQYRNLIAGQFISITGSQMQQVGLVWQLYVFTKSPLALGALGLFRIIPVIIFALIGGVVADTFDRRKIMIASQTVMAMASLALAFTTLASSANAYTIYALAAVGGTALAFDSPARQSLVPLLLPRDVLSNGLAIYGVVWQTATILGPAIGGLVLAHFGVVPIYIVDAISFLAVITALVTMRPLITQTRSASGFSLRSLADGLRFLKGAPLIRTTMLLDFFATFFGGSMLLMPIFADKILDVGPRGMGWLYSAQPAGAAIAAFVISTRQLPRAQGKAILWAVAAYGAAITGFGISTNFGLSLVLLAIAGAADMVSTVIRQTLRQLLTPDELRGRMTSLNMIFFMGGPQLGEAEAGVAAKWFGPRFSVGSGGALCLLTAAIVALLAPGLRRYRSE